MVQVPIAIRNPPRGKIVLSWNSTAAPPRLATGRYQKESFDLSMKNRRVLNAGKSNL